MISDVMFPRIRLLAPRVRRTALLACVLSIGLAAGAACDRPWSGTPGDASPEAGFARDMATHHAQAVEMGFIVRDASHDERLRALAYDIIVTQATQRGIFMGWLQQWGLPQSSSEPRMAWMKHGPGMPGMTMPAAPAGLMPGMATPAEMDALGHATGTDAEILFLRLMIRHHQGGLDMARAIVAQSTREEVVGMARNIESTQAVEIATMTDMLAERHATPM